MTGLVYCPCGKPLHYSDSAKRKIIEQQIDLLGADVPVRYQRRTWFIPRHYAALHRITAAELPKLKFPELLSEDEMLFPFLHNSGAALISRIAPDYEGQIFTHQDTDGRIRHFHINTLAQMISRDDGMELAELPVEQKQVDFILLNRGIEHAHLTERMSDEFAEKPGIICLFPDDSQLIVDGHHRYVKRDLMGKKTMLFWLVSETLWRKSLVRVLAQHEMS